MEKLLKELDLFLKTKGQKAKLPQEQKNIGYSIVNKKFEINPSEAQNIVNLYNYFIDVNGNLIETYKYFLKHFNGKGQDSLYKYLRDTSYIGKYKLYRKEIYLENYIPRIMEDDLFFQVQRLLVKKEKFTKNTTSISLFSGITYCNICNNRMCKKQDNRVKTKLIRYCCDNASRRKVGSMDYKCSNHKLIREECIEEYLLKHLRSLGQNCIMQNEIISSNKTVNDNSKEIKEIERKIYKLKDLYLNDLIDREMYEVDYKKLKADLDIKKNKIVSEPKKDFSKLREYINLNFEKIYSTFTSEEKRTFWLDIIDKIYIENGEIKEVMFL